MLGSVSQMLPIIIYTLSSVGSADLSERRQFHDDVSAQVLRHDPKELDNVRVITCM